MELGALLAGPMNRIKRKVVPTFHCMPLNLLKRFIARSEGLIEEG
jgi:hypothetical protein